MGKGGQVDGKSVLLEVARDAAEEGRGEAGGRQTKFSTLVSFIFFIIN